MLPGYFDVFRRVNVIRRGKIPDDLPDFNKTRYGLGIYLVGFRAVPIILSLCEIRPDKVVFVVTPDSQSMVEEIKSGVMAIDEDLW